MPPKKKLAAIIKLQIQAGAATPAPPVGPALGQHGVNIMEFCKAYNAATESQRGQIVPVEISVFEDRSFTFITKTPPAARADPEAAAGIEKGSGEPHKTKVARLTRDQVRAIAETKMPDLNANDLDAAEKIIAGTARQMGITVEGRPAEPARSARPWEGRARPVVPRLHGERPQHPNRRSSNEAQQGLPRGGREDRRRRPLRPPRGRPAGQGDVHHEVRRDRRGRDAPGRRPPQGRPDGPRHRQPAARHRQDRPGPGLRHR